MLFAFIPLPAPDRTSRRHHARRSGRLETAGHHGVITCVTKHLKALLDQHFRRLERRDRVRQEGGRVGQDFQLDPVGTRVSQAFEQLATKPGGPHASSALKQPAVLGRIV